MLSDGAWQDFRMSNLSDSSCLAQLLPTLMKRRFLLRRLSSLSPFACECGSSACMFMLMCFSPLTHCSSHTPSSCLLVPPLQTHGSYVPLSVLTLCVVELQTRRIFSSLCSMEVRKRHERAVHAQKRAALHRPLTLDV